MGPRSGTESEGRARGSRGLEAGAELATPGASEPGGQGLRCSWILLGGCGLSLLWVQVHRKWVWGSHGAGSRGEGQSNMCWIQRLLSQVPLGFQAPKEGRRGGLAQAARPGRLCAEPVWLPALL